MFKNCNMYCFKNFIPNHTPFVKITNYTNLNIYFILQYTLPTGTKTRVSPVFKKDYSEKIHFYNIAKNIAFNVLSSPNHDFICNRVLQTPVSSYFKVIETSTGGVACIQD